jgi:PEP-CTERM motif
MSLIKFISSSTRLKAVSTLCAPIALAFGLGFAQGTQAATVSFTGFSHGSEAVQLASPFQGTVSAGEFAMTADGMPLTSFCIDLMQSIGFGRSYSNYSVVSLTGLNENINALQLGRFSKLYENYLPTAHTSSTGSAAFQTAVWEILSDGKGTMNLSTGVFSLANAFSASSRALAEEWLATLDAKAAGSWGFDKYGSTTQQDQLVGKKLVSQVPVPATLALLAVGFIGIGAARKYTLKLN